MTTPALELRDVGKEFIKDRETVRAVDGVNLVVEQGEMVVFLGPSGCGKTTTLRMVAGFELPTSGSITIQGKDMTSVPVNRRGIGFVFQSYALFPHMSVERNVAYGLKSRGEAESEIGPKVQAALDLVGLGGAGRRFPGQLSGGEQQRVALARVLVMEPTLLLMDEPLSNLDAKLRIRMRSEIRRIQKKLGITCLYVTHDQAEALTMADRVVVMNRGRVEQIGTPREMYSRPDSAFVADFIGQANIIPLPFLRMEEGDMAVASLPGGGSLRARMIRPGEADAGSGLRLVLRPENVEVCAHDTAPAAEGLPSLEAVVRAAIFVGRHIEYELDLDGHGSISAEQVFTPDADFFAEGDRVRVRFDPASALFLPGDRKS
jgi:iron(III) transport system ATP-binding protein